MVFYAVAIGIEINWDLKKLSLREKEIFIDMMKLEVLLLIYLTMVGTNTIVR